MTKIPDQCKCGGMKVTGHRCPIFRDEFEPKRPDSYYKAHGGHNTSCLTSNIVQSLKLQGRALERLEMTLRHEMFDDLSKHAKGWDCLCEGTKDHNGSADCSDQQHQKRIWISWIQDELREVVRILSEDKE